MLDINTLKTSPYFEHLSLEANQVLFEQGEKDGYIYLIVSGELEVKKYSDTTKTSTKTLANLKTGEVFGEASLHDDTQKEVSIEASCKTELLRIDAQKDFQDFLKNSSKLALELLKQIILSSNRRLSKANSIITATDEINKQIRELGVINYKSIFGIINNTRLIVPCDRILYIEKHSSLEYHHVLRYDTSSEDKLLSEVIETKDFTKEDIEVIQGSSDCVIETLQIETHVIGHLIYIREKDLFDRDELKIMSSISPLIGGIIQQKKMIDESK